MGTWKQVKNNKIKHTTIQILKKRKHKNMKQ